jgi:spore coat polysaccharide biosynthesis protein SpsF
MTTSAIIEARMTSSRLPGKVLKKVLGKSMLKYLIERLKLVDSLDNIIIATTKNSADDVIEKFSIMESIKNFRGSENNVLERVLCAARENKVDTIVKITADCPIIDPNIVEFCIRMFKKNNIDFLSNGHLRTYPDGMDVAVFKTSSLEKSYKNTSEKLDLEHVTLHMRNNPKMFTPLYVVAPPELHWPELGLTLDEEDDLKLISKIIKHFGKDKIFTCGEAINFIRTNKNLLKINEEVIRKGDS